MYNINMKYFSAFRREQLDDDDKNMTMQACDVTKNNTPDNFKNNCDFMYLQFQSSNTVKKNFKKKELKEDADHGTVLRNRASSGGCDIMTFK